MRISSNQIAESSLYNISSAMERYAAAQEKLSSGKQVTKPSDDPSGVHQAIDLSGAMDTMDQYQRNINDAKAFLGTTDSALATATTLLRQARTYAVQGASNVLSKEAQQGIADQISSIVQSLGRVGNTMYGSRYIFSGQMTLQKAFAGTGTTFTYQGGTAANGNDKLNVEIAPNQTIQMNVAGDTAFSQAFTALDSLATRLASGDVAQISQSDLQTIDDALNGVVAVRADVGTRVQQLSARASQLDQSKSQFADYLSKIVDTDIPKTVVDLNSAQNAYQAALAATARGFQQSLLDFIR